MSSTFRTRRPPKFDDPDDERLHRKQRLAAAFRIFGRLGFGEGVAGHMAARATPNNPTTIGSIRTARASARSRCPILSWSMVRPKPCSKATIRSRSPRPRSIRLSTARAPTSLRRFMPTPCTAGPGRAWAARSVRLPRMPAPSSKIRDYCRTKPVSSWTTRKADASARRWARTRR
jgi:hypothetical protein